MLAARDEAALAKINREVARKKIKVRTQACDVRDPHSVEALFRAARRQFQRLDILINNAGIAHPNLPVEKLPYPVWKDVLATNLDGTFLVTQAALAMMKCGSAVVNNLSIAATRVFPGSAAYNASKHAALGLTNTLREELRPRGIRVIALLPGATNTDIWTTLWPQAPRKKMLDPETVAQAVVQAILLPENATMENLEIRPTGGTL
jgi:NAD(P)-dependent dehydrogenase (short-subunit alcohol dehydrogenase family)